MTEAAIGETGEWTNKVEIADLDGDGLPDLLFANGGLYEEPGDPEPARVFHNDGAGAFSEATDAVFGDERFLSRAIRTADVDADGLIDLLVTGTFQTATRLFRGLGDGRFERTDGAVPGTPMSIGDAEFGDVDGDRDLDLALSDWGAGSPMANDGGRTRLWLNDGGRYVDATESMMPDVLVRFSWELELVDVDGDWDLDLAVSCKQCTGSFLFENNGSGSFTDVTAGRMPQTGNNYEFEPMDMDADGDLDLITINDGGPGLPHLAERILLNDGGGTFADATAELWPSSSNPGFDDNMAAFLDVESDGDADFIIGSLDGPDRLLVNDGQGRLTLRTDIIDTTTPSGGTLGLALADLDRDGRLDLVEAQGEVPGHESERVYLGTGLAPDSAPPSVAVEQPTPTGPDVTVRARVHDHKSPSRPLDLHSVVLRWSAGSAEGEREMAWYGEYLWRGDVTMASGQATWEVCAADAAGNEACSEPVAAEIP